MEDFIESISEFIKKIGLLSSLMILLSILSLISFLIDGNYLAAIWAFNTMLWVGISCINECRANTLQDKVNELLDELHKKEKEEKTEEKGNETT